MQLINLRGFAAVLAIVMFAGCSHDPPDALDSPPSVSIVSATNSLADVAGTTGLLADLTDLGTLYAPADNWWNLDVSNAPLDNSSAAIVSTIMNYEATGGRLHPRLGSIHAMPDIVVDSSTPRVPVTFQYAAESDAGAPGAPVGYPIPAEAITNPRFMEEEGAVGSNKHLLMIDRGQRAAYELAGAAYVNGKWTAKSGAIFPLTYNHRRPEGWTSADAAGLCVTAGLLRYDEVYGSAPIRHALRCSIRQVNGYVYPASHKGASDAMGLPLGMRLRLRQSFDISGYSAPVQKIFQALKTYGLIVADRGGNMYVQGTMDSRWNNAVLNPAFHALKVTDFDVVQRGWKGGDTTPPPPPPPPPPGEDPDGVPPLGLLANMADWGPVYDTGDNWWNLRVDAAPLEDRKSTRLNSSHS